MSPFSLSPIIPFGDSFVVEIYINEVLWDYREFVSKEEAQAFLADPLKADRSREIVKTKREAAKELAMIPYRAASYERISRGRRIAAKPGSA